MSNHDPLREALRHRADQLGDSHPLTLDDVKGRARGIRRRRTAVTGLAAAAVLAVAVPVGLAVTDTAGITPDDPPVAEGSGTPSPDGTSTPDGSPSPEGPQKEALTTEVDENSYAPEIPYLYQGAIVRPDGTEVPVEADYQALAPAGDGWAALRNDNGNMFVDLLDAEGDVTGSERSTGYLAVSADGTVASYATPGGELMTVTADGEPTPLVEPEALPDGTLAPVAVIGSESCDQDAEGGGCAVYFNSSDVEVDALAEVEQVDGAWSATSKGIVSPIPDLLNLGGVSPDGSLSGMVSASDTGSCSVVIGPDGEQLWKTCDYTLGQFSPDGRYVIGHPAYRDGIGDPSVAILDARTGDLLAEFQNSMKHQSFINNVVWDTDSTLLATVFEEGTWSLMRMTASGELSSVLDGIGDNMDQVPVTLATRP